MIAIATLTSIRTVATNSTPKFGAKLIGTKHWQPHPMITRNSTSTGLRTMICCVDGQHLVVWHPNVNTPPLLLLLLRQYQLLCSSNRRSAPTTVRSSNNCPNALIHVNGAFEILPNVWQRRWSYVRSNNRATGMRYKLATVKFAHSLATSIAITCPSRMPGEPWSWNLPNRTVEQTFQHAQIRPMVDRVRM